MQFPDWCFDLTASASLQEALQKERAAVTAFRTDSLRSVRSQPPRDRAAGCEHSSDTSRRGDRFTPVETVAPFSQHTPRRHVDVMIARPHGTAPRPSHAAVCEHRVPSASSPLGCFRRTAIAIAPRTIGDEPRRIDVPIDMARQRRSSSLLVSGHLPDQRASAEAADFEWRVIEAVLNRLNRTIAQVPANKHVAAEVA